MLRRLTPKTKVPDSLRGTSDMMVWKISSPQWNSTVGLDEHPHWLKVGHYDPGFIDEIHANLEALRSLPKNWDGYGAPVVDPQVIDAAECFIKQLPENLAYRPHVVPTSTGSLQLEWQEGAKSLELEFESPRTIRYLQWQPDQDIEKEDSIAVKEIDRAVDLIQWCMSGSGQ